MFNGIFSLFYLYFLAKRIKSAAKVLPVLVMEYVKSLRHNVKARSSLFHPSGLIPFPFGFSPALPKAVYYGDSDHPVSGQIDPGVS
jgi:hypothetical protein